MNWIIVLLLTPFALWGAADMFICFFKFLRGKSVDKTAGITWWWSGKWGYGTQTEHVVKVWPWVSQDLTEALGIRPDDGNTS